MFNMIRVISRHQDTQIYGAILPVVLSNQEMLDFKAYKEYYAVASGAEPPKEKIKYTKKEDERVSYSKSKTTPASKGSRLKSSAKVAKTAKKKQPATMPKTKGLAVLSEVALSVAEQIKLATNQDDEDANEETYMNDDSKETKSDNDGDDLTHHNLYTYKVDDEEEEEEKGNDKEEEEKEDDDEVSLDHRVYTPPDYQLTDEEENHEGDNEVKEGEEEQDDKEELYRYLNINLQRSDAEMTVAQQENVQANQVTEDTHVTLTIVPPAVQQQSSSVSSDLVSKFINRSSDTAISLIPGIVDNYLASKMKDAVDVAVQLQTNKLREEAQAENQEFLNQKNLYNAMVESYNSNKEIFPSYGDVVTLKRGKDYQDKDEDPSAGSNRGLKRRRSGKEAESSKEPTHKESKSTRNDDETSVREALDVDESRILSQKYTTFVTKTKAADSSQVKWIEDKVSRIWSTKKVVYDKHAYWETYHWGPKRQKFYEYAYNMETSKDVYSRHMSIRVTRLKIMKYFGYSYLEEIIVRR
nr:hypothetical protein [Tanacetum cinerariifolium]